VSRELPNISRIYFLASRFITFSKVKNSFIRIVNDDTDEEIARYKLEDNYCSSKSIKLGKLSKNDSNGSWEFTAIDEEVV